MSTNDKFNARRGREETIRILHILGYEVNTRDFKFRLRDGERTPSAYVHKDGGVQDFGSSFKGTIVDLLVEYHNYSSVGEAIKEAKRLFGDEDSVIDSSTQTHHRRQNSSYVSKKEPQEEKEREVLDDSKIEYLCKNRDKFHSYYLDLMRKLLPSLGSDEERIRLGRAFEIGYSSSLRRLTMPIRDYNGTILNMWRYNPSFDAKVFYVAGYDRAPIFLQRLLEYRKEPEKIILICEGEKDVLNAIGNGYRAITTGGMQCTFREKDLPYLEGLRFAIYGDYDDAGKVFNAKISKQLFNVAKDIRIVDWQEDVFYKYPDLKPKKGFDLTDLLTYKRRSQK